MTTMDQQPVEAEASHDTKPVSGETGFGETGFSEAHFTLTARGEAHFTPTRPRP